MIEGAGRGAAAVSGMVEEEVGEGVNGRVYDSWKGYFWAGADFELELPLKTKPVVPFGSLSSRTDQEEGVCRLSTWALGGDENIGWTMMAPCLPSKIKGYSEVSCRQLQRQGVSIYFSPQL